MVPTLAARILLFVVALLCSAQAQAEAANPRIGVLSPGTPESAAPILAALRQGLRDQGYIEGTNIALEYRFGHGQFDRLPGLVRELIGLKVDVLVTVVTQARGPLTTRSTGPAGTRLLLGDRQWRRGG